jgi:hypothetical protein
MHGSTTLQTHRVSWIHLDSYRLALHPPESYVYRMRSGRDLRLQAPEHRRHTDLDPINVDMESAEPGVTGPATAVQDHDPSSTLSHVVQPTSCCQGSSDHRRSRASRRTESSRTRSASEPTLAGRPPICVEEVGIVRKSSGSVFRVPSWPLGFRASRASYTRGKLDAPWTIVAVRAKRMPSVRQTSRSGCPS